MKFDKIWTKEKNKLLRQFKKEKKDSDFINEYFKEEFKHLYGDRKSNILPFQLFNKINEILIQPAKTYYEIKTYSSILNSSKNDYYLFFNCDTVNYVIIFMYYKIQDIPTYNLIFTTKIQFIKYIDKIQFISNNNDIVSDKDREELKNILEEESHLNHLILLFKKLCYIIKDFYDTQLKNFVLSIGETDNPVKIELYKNIIKHNYPNIKEEVVLDELNNKVFLFHID